MLSAIMFDKFSHKTNCELPKKSFLFLPVSAIHFKFGGRDHVVTKNIPPKFYSNQANGLGSSYIGTYIRTNIL